MKREYKIIQSNIRRKQGEFCELTFIHFLINIKSNYKFGRRTEIYKNKDIRRQLVLVKNGNLSVNGDFKFFLKKEFPDSLLPSKVKEYYGESVRNKETRGLPF